LVLLLQTLLRRLRAVFQFRQNQARGVVAADTPAGGKLLKNGDGTGDPADDAQVQKFALMCSDLIGIMDSSIESIR
jgi:hypothetical protein